MPSAPRVVALVGPYLSGKTTLLESLLFASGTTSRRGSVRDGNSVGDHAPEARARSMSTEINVANANFLGDPWTILDCPGSVELLYEAQQAMLVADTVVVVCEPEVERAVTVSALLHFLARHDIPHMLFINKLDAASARVRDVLAALQSVSERPLVLRQVPLRGGESEITGYVDLVSERAYRYRPGQASDLIPLPDGFWDQEGDTRTSLVEKLADFDDALLEQLLEDVQPSKEDIYKHLTKDFQKNLIVPVFVGAAAQDYGVRRLWKALRHETPGPAETAARLGIAPQGEPLGAGVQDLSPAAYRQAVAGARLARLGGGRQRAERGARRRGRQDCSAAAGEGAGRQDGRGRRADPDGGNPDRHGPDPVRQGRQAAAAGEAATGLWSGDPCRKARRRRQADRVDRQADRGGPDPRTRTERRDARDGAVGAGRRASADRARPAAPPAEPVGRRPPCGGAVQGDDPQAARQQHSRFKRQSGGHGQFADCTIEVEPAAARLRVHVQGQRRRRRDPAQLHPGRRGGRRRGLARTARSAFRSSISRST